MDVKKELSEIKLRLEKVEKEVNSEKSSDWVEINNENCPTLSKYGVKPFKIMKKKMRKDGKVWNDINFTDAQKEAEKLGYRLPDLREILALLEHYRNSNKSVSIHDKSFLGIEELSYDEDVCYEWVDMMGVGFLRSGVWAYGTDAGVFTLVLYNSAPGYSGYIVGFRCAATL